MDNDLDYQVIKPDALLSDFVESYWMLHNRSGQPREVVILPDGRIDLFFSRSDLEPFHISLMGIGVQQEPAVIAPGTLTFAISFRLPAVEYIFHNTVSDLVGKAINLPPGFWDFSAADLDDFGLFCSKAALKVASLLSKEIDERKRALFRLVYASNGGMTVKELSDQVFWSSRQINRYFNQQYGLTLKAYCSILRFRASFPHIREGKLYPTQNFADQSHFIKEVKKLSGALPKELSRNRNDRFIQFSTLPRE